MKTETRQLTDKFMMRFPDGWKTALKIAAARNRRSVNAEILSRLAPSVEPEVEAEQSKAEQP